MFNNLKIIINNESFVSEGIISKGIKGLSGYKEVILSPLILLRLESTIFVFLKSTIR